MEPPWKSLRVMVAFFLDIFYRRKYDSSSPWLREDAQSKGGERATRKTVKIPVRWWRNSSDCERRKETEEGFGYRFALILLRVGLELVPVARWFCYFHSHISLFFFFFLNLSFY